MRRIISLVMAGALVVVVCGIAIADTCGDLVCDGGGDGLIVTLTVRQLGFLRNGLDVDGKPLKVAYEYRSRVACSANDINGPSVDEVYCVRAVTACAGNPPSQGRGPLTVVYRREVDAAGRSVSGWAPVGRTCFPELAPGSTVLGLGSIISAFNRTVFARPGLHLQPEGDVTLVRLPVFYEVRWPAAGFQPLEVDAFTLLGYRVKIRPTLDHYTYLFGDGNGVGPTRNPGGPWPEGLVRHPYERPGSFVARVDVTYGGEFSVNGSAWAPIPATATVTGTPQPLVVKTAKNVLIR